MDIYYTKNHEWVKIDGKVGTMGISEYAVSQLGDIVFIKLPDKEKKYQQDETLAETESVKAASDIYSPLSGKVIEVNSKLDQSPEIINNSPQDQGWIAKIELDNLNELKNLMDTEQYKKHLKTLS